MDSLSKYTPIEDLMISDLPYLNEMPRLENGNLFLNNPMSSQTFLNDDSDLHVFEKSKSLEMNQQQDEIHKLNRLLTEEKCKSAKLASELNFTKENMGIETTAKEDLSQQLIIFNKTLGKYKDILFDLKIKKGQDEFKFNTVHKENLETIKKLQNEIIINDKRKNEDLDAQKKLAQELTEVKNRNEQMHLKLKLVQQFEEQYNLMLKEKLHARKDLEEKVLQIQSQLNSIERFQENENIYKNDIAQLKSELYKKDRGLDEAQQTKRELQSSFSRELEFLKNTKELEFKSFKDAKELELKSLADSKSLEIKTLKEGVEREEAKNKQLNQINYTQEKDVVRLKNSEEQLQAEVTRLQNQLREMQDSYADFKSKTTSSILGIQELSARLTAADREREIMIQQFKNLESQNFDLNKELSQKTTAGDSEKDQIKKWINQLSNREIQVRDYIADLDLKRKDFIDRVEKFKMELTVSTALHPLRDFLKVTEYQIDQLQMNLIKVPALSPDRANLETQHENLSEQRNFLKTITNSSREQTEKQIQQLEKLTQMGQLALLPPMPQRKAIF
jgi:hypothetical protein